MQHKVKIKVEKAKQSNCGNFGATEKYDRSPRWRCK